MLSRLSPKGYVLLPQWRTFCTDPVYSQKIKLIAVLHANAGVPPVAHAYPRARRIYFTFSCHLRSLPRWPPPRKTYLPNKTTGYIAGHKSRTHARCPFCHAGNVPTAFIDTEKPSHSRSTPHRFPQTKQPAGIKRRTAQKRTPSTRGRGQVGEEPGY